MLLKNYIRVLNHRTVIAVIIAFVATWICYRYHLIFNLDLTLISVAVIFPLVFTLGSAFQRREKALEHLGRAKGALAAIKYCFSWANKIEVTETEKINVAILKVKEDLIEFLHTGNGNKAPLNASIGEIQHFVDRHRDALGRSLSLRIYRLMRDVIMGVENAVAIKDHRTPMSIRAYCKIFIYVFPFFYAPTLIKNIQYPSLSAMDVSQLPDVPVGDFTYVLVIYILNVTISFFLITLYNIQEQIEDPFDQNGLDDIQLENYLIDY